MKSLQLYALLTLTIVPNVYLQAMIKGLDGKQENKKPLYELSELKWSPHGEKDVCDCPKIGDPSRPETYSELTPNNVSNSFWGKIAQCSQGDKDEALRKVMRVHDGRWACNRRFMAAAVYAGANPNIKQYVIFGNNPLYPAVLLQDYSLTKFLLKHKADPNLKVDGDSPALSKAQNKKLAELLLEHSAEVKGKGYMGMTPLHEVMTSATHEADLAQLYIDKGADVDAVDDCGNTPLHWLACCCSLFWYEVAVKAQALFSAGASSLNARDEEGRTAIQRAQELIHNSNGKYRISCERLIKMIKDEEKKRLTSDNEIIEKPLKGPSSDETIEFALLMLREGLYE